MKTCIIGEFQSLVAQTDLLMRRGDELLQEFQHIESSDDREALVDSTKFLLQQVEGALADVERMFTLMLGSKLR